MYLYFHVIYMGNMQITHTPLGRSIKLLYVTTGRWYTYFELGLNWLKIYIKRKCRGTCFAAVNDFWFLHEELRNVQEPCSVVCLVKQRILQWDGHVDRDAYRIFVGKV